MTVTGTVRGGVVVPDLEDLLPEGSRVTIELEHESGVSDEFEPSFASLLELAGTVEGLPPDMARNHNHYLHGHPKK